MEQTIRRYDSHMHALFKQAREMWNNYISERVYYSTELSHKKVVGALNKDYDYLWETVQRVSPFEYVREKLDAEGIHIKCKKLTFPEYTEYHLYVEPFEQEKVVPEPHQETTDKKFAQYVREYDTMKHELEGFVRFLITKAEETQQPVEWVISSDFEKSLRVVGALDKANEHKWKYINRVSPFLAIRKKIMNETKYHVASKYLGVAQKDRKVLSFKVRVEKQKQSETQVTEVAEVAEEETQVTPQE